MGRPYSTGGSGRLGGAVARNGIKVLIRGNPYEQVPYEYELVRVYRTSIYCIWDFMPPGLGPHHGPA